MEPEGLVVTCIKCGKQHFALLEHGWHGIVKCPQCGDEIMVIDSKMMRTAMRKEIEKNLSMQGENQSTTQANFPVRSKQTSKSPYKLSWWKRLTNSFLNKR